MQYNFHNEKYKMSDVGGIKKEQFREYENSNKYKNYVNPELSKDNIYKDMVEDGCDWYKHIREAKASTQEITGRAVRKDAVVLCSTVESVPVSWDREACKEYFQDKADWYGKYLHEKGGADEGCLKSLVVHLDETTPHATYAWVPEMDGKLQAKNILDREFLRDLQKDSQNFTFEWIDKWNTNHPDRRLEELQPYNMDSNRKHLTEQEYKEQKIEEHVEQMKQQLEATKQEIGDLQEKNQILEDKTQEAVEAKETYKYHSDLAKQKVVEYEQKILEVTEAPDIPTYNKVIEENTSLKEELSLKEQIIEKLQEANSKLQEHVEHWKEQAIEWRDRFSDMAHKAGSKLMEYFGYNVSKDESIKTFPSREISEGFSKIKGEVVDRNPKQYRVLPDNENEGMFRVAYREKDGSYETIKDGFYTRDAAESWQRDVVSGAINLNDNIDIDNGIK